MSLTSAMYSGVSGLGTNGDALSVIGNNIANVNTVGFKEGRTLFSDMLSTTMSKAQIGSGVQLQSVQNLFSQGTFQPTQNATDLAIQGDGMFILKDPSGIERFYSRAGAFTFDQDKILTNADGYQVLGYGISNDVANGTLGPIQLSAFANLAPKATSTMGVVINLDASQSPPTAAWDPTAAGFNPNLASNFSTSMPYYDTAGNSKTLTLYFENTSAGNWNLHTYDGAAYSAAIPVSFNANGTVDSVGGVAGATSVSTNGLTLDIGGSTQYTNPSTVFSQNQDGYGAGNLVKVNVDEHGYVQGSYSNGQQHKIAQIALARFAAVQGLEKLGNSLYGETAASGSALIGASSMNSNQILANSLEQSNVDMADQLVKMITTQRAYSANSKTITAADQLMQDTLNLIR